MTDLAPVVGKKMRITRIEDFHCDAGWRVLSFLKVSTDAGIVGWSEYSECYSSRGVTAVIRQLGQTLIGRDPWLIELTVASLRRLVLEARGGINQQAIAAIENALLDIKGKALGVPVCSLFGGPVRISIPLYWSHCGGVRLRHADLVGVTPIKSLDDIERLGAEVVQRGFTALKTNIFRLDSIPPSTYMPCFSGGPGAPELNADHRILTAIKAELAAFRRGAGPETAIHIDLNFNFKTEGFVRIIRQLEEFDLSWIEIDSLDPIALRHIRRNSPAPIASLETLYSRHEYRPFLERGAVDVAIIDVMRVGMTESTKIASFADTYEVNVAPHNYYGHLATMISAHFCSAVPNFRIMEIDIDEVPWKDELFTQQLTIKDGHLLMATAPGWGTEVNEAAVLAHPPKGDFRV